MLVNRLVEFCRKAGYVTEEQEPWIKYILEKRITTICVLIPFFVIGVALTSLATAASFLVSFYLLRSRINGFHAKTFWGCFVASLIWEFVFLGLVYPIINNVASLIVLAVSIVAILMLAPFRHPSLPLSEDEYQASKCSARYRLALLTIVYIVFALFNLKAAALGILLGIAMAAVMLILAYLYRKGDDRIEKAE